MAAERSLLPRRRPASTGCVRQCAYVASAPPASPSVTSYRQNDEDNNDHQEQVARQVKGTAAEEQEQ